MVAQAMQEPSMEEILASIRRIISKDDGGVAVSDPGTDSAGIRQNINSKNQNSGSVSTSSGEDEDVVRPLSFSGYSNSSIKTSGETTSVHENPDSSIPEKEFNSNVLSPGDKIMRRGENNSGQNNTLENRIKQSSDLNSQFIDSRDKKDFRSGFGSRQSPSAMSIPEDGNFSLAEEANVRGRRDSAFSGECYSPIDDGGKRNMEPGRELTSSQTNESVSASFQQLKSLAIDDIDDKVIRLLKPMLREWLDDNLPVMVERLVRNEIERVSRSG